MSMIGVVSDLTVAFLWIGIIGAGIAVLCALIALYALARGAPGLVGGAAAVWIGGALLSLTSGFSGQWLPVLLSIGALAAALILGGVLRPVVRAIADRPKPEAPESTTQPPSGASPAPRRVVGVRTVASESIR